MAVEAPSESRMEGVETRFRDIRRPLRVIFYANGDRYFRGKKLSIMPNRYFNFADLLSDITHRMPCHLHLPNGVRQICTPHGGHRVHQIGQIEDGQAYVCCGNEAYKEIMYGKQELEPWSKGVAGRAQHNEAVSYLGAPTHGRYLPTDLSTQYAAHNAFPPGRFQRGNRGSYLPIAAGSNRFTQLRGTGGPAEPLPPIISKPKVVSVVRNGPKPRDVVKVLLNRRSVQSFPQLMSDISESFGPRFKDDKLTKLYSVGGKEIQNIGDFFRDDDIFIGAGSEDLSLPEVQELLDELYPDNPYAKNLVRQWEKRRRQAERRRGKAGVGHVKEVRPSGEEEKRDSGFDESETSKEGEEEHKAEKAGSKQTTQPVKKRRRRRPSEISGHGDRRTSRDHSPTNVDPALAALINAKQEREKARQRLMMRLEADRKSIDTERRSRGLPMLRQDPLKRMQQDREKDRQQRLRRKAEADRAKQSTTQDQTGLTVDTVSPGREQAVTGVVDQQMQHMDRLHQEKEKEKESEKLLQQQQHAYQQQQEKQKAHAAAQRREEAAEGQAGPGVITGNRLSPLKEGDAATTKKVHGRHGKRGSLKRTKSLEGKGKQLANLEGKGYPTKQEPKTKMEDRPIGKFGRQVSDIQAILDIYQLGKTLGDGNFAVVRHALKKTNSHEYAMKVIDKAKLRGREGMVESEIAIMKLCHHPNIIQLKEEYETKDEIYLVMELVKGGDLFEVISQCVKFNEVQSASMVRDVANALFYLHSRHIVHRDLKPENLVVMQRKDNSITLKLADFGLALEITRPVFTVCGTPTYVAPEILEESGYGLEVDLWALGVITYIMLCGFPPFRSPERRQTELFALIKSGQFQYLSPYWDVISRSAKDLISNLLVVDTRRRYKAIDTLCHPWIISLAGSLEIEGSMAMTRITRKSELDVKAEEDYREFLKLKESGRKLVQVPVA